MSIEAILGELRGIMGYKCSGVMDFTGEVLVKDTVDNSIDFDMAATTFNDILRGAHEAAGKVSLQATTDMLLQTPNGLILMQCSGVRSEPHIHMFCVLDQGGNHALAKMSITKQVPKIIKELS